MTRLAGRSVLIVAALKSALDLGFANHYGWQRDELYYAVAGKHLQGGYVEFPPVTALLSALARVLFGYSLVGFRIFPVLAGAIGIVVAALVARELGGGGRAQVIAAIAVGFSPIVLATNGLFQPVSFDSLATLIVLWLALRLALGRGSWTWIGIAIGVGLETKYTLSIPLLLVVATFAVWRRDALQPAGVARATAIAAVLLVPNLVWEAQHGWVSVHFFVHPPGSATDETRPQFIVNVLLLVARVGTGCLPRAPSHGRSSGVSSRTSCSAASRITPRRKCCSRSQRGPSHSRRGRRGAACGSQGSHTGPCSSSRFRSSSPSCP